MSKQHVHWKVTSDPFVLNLDKGFNPLTGHFVELEYKTFVFRGGEPHFQITSEVNYLGHLTITQRYNSINNLFLIVLAVDAARRIGFKTIDLILPYFPAARQDRVCNSGEPLTVKVMADIVNGCGFDNVFIFSPHSEVVTALINNVKVLSLDEIFIQKIIEEVAEGHVINIVSPDAGSEKRTEKLVQTLSKNNPWRRFDIVKCGKVRDVSTGELKSFHVNFEDLKGNPVLLTDDICSMGGTFIGLGKELKDRNAGKMYLYTSHADCVEGVQNMVEYFDKYFTTNSKKNWNEFKYTLDDKLTVFDITL